MSHAFSISRSLSSVLADADLEDLIKVQTGSVEEASSIVRSIRRFGEDASILHYDMTRNQGRSSRYARRPPGWTVRAVRP